MLKRLHIRHYAIIEDVDISFGHGLNMMTGETGAGKSIVLGALSLLLGERADAQSVQEGETKCIVEATFQYKTTEVTEYLEANDFDSVGPEIILRREVYRAGKSRAFINDTPATLQQLTELSDYLIDIHRQHQTLSLQQRSFQLFVIDNLAGNHARLASYKKSFLHWQQMSQQLTELKMRQAAVQTTFDFNQFQLKELTQASLTGNAEQESLEAELKLLEHAGELQVKLSELLQIMDQGDVNALALIKSAQQQMQSLVRKMPQAEVLANRLLDVREQLADIGSEAETLLDQIENNPQRIGEIQERLSTLYHLQKKHRVQDVDSLIRIQQQLEYSVLDVSRLDEEINRLENESLRLFGEVLQMAGAISLQRKQVIPVFEKQIKQLLKSVGMAGAELRVHCELLSDAQVTVYGLDKIEFYFSANKGFTPQPIYKMASGGELSRLMLCIKSLIAKNVALPTLVFDEIDNGISGETAQQVALLMRQIASTHQVICITHLPQMAAKADVHFYIYKELKQHKTHTLIKPLTNDERVIEIAKMLSGEKPGQAALQNAKELIDL